MTYKDIIDKTDKFYPNEYDTKEKLWWIDCVNADIVRNIEKQAEDVPPAEEEDGAIVLPPYDDMYIYYILAQIAYHQRDGEAYQRHIMMYAARFNDYMSYYLRTFGGETNQITGWI